MSLCTFSLFSTLLLCVDTTELCKFSLVFSFAFSAHISLSLPLTHRCSSTCGTFQQFAVDLVRGLQHTYACMHAHKCSLSLSLSLSLSFEFAANARCSHTARMIASDPCSLMRHDAKQDRVYIKPRDSILNSKSTFSSSVSHVPDFFFLAICTFPLLCVSCTAFFCF